MKVTGFVLLFFFISTVAFGQNTNTPITMVDALRIFRAENPNLASARLHREAIRANEITARLRPNPTLTTAKEDFDFFHPSQLNPSSDNTANISQVFERGNKRQFRIESARLGSQIAEDQYRDLLRQGELSVKQAFVAMLLAKSDLELALDNLRDYKKTVEISQSRFQAGDISGIDLDRIRLQQSRFESDLLDAELKLELQRSQLAALLGRDPAIPFDIEGTLDPPTLVLDQNRLLEQALAGRPDYMAALDSVKKANADIRQADAGGATDVTLGTEFKRSGDENFIGFTFSMPLRIFDRNQGEKARTRREADSSRFAEQAMRLQVSTDFFQAWLNYRNTQKHLTVYSPDYLQRARDVRDRIEFSYRQGGSSLLDYLDALREFRDAEIASRAAKANMVNAIHQLSFVTGTELLP